MAEADSARLCQKFRLDWNYNSNRIEGNTLTRGETKALLEEGVEPKRMSKDIFEMRSHDKAVDFLFQLTDSETPITEVDIRSLHKTALGANYTREIWIKENVKRITEIEVGTYKKKANHVTRLDGTSHIFASPQEVPAKMKATVERLRRHLKTPDMPLHDYLAELHQDFIETHPFDDGNGRVVRLLVNYVCMKCGWPPVIIKSEKRSEYIASLESWNDGDERPFRELMKRELIWSLKKSIAAARGEDIEDDGDNDKEIDLFVQEVASEAFKPLKNEANIASVFSTAISPVLRMLDKKLRKFSRIFTTYIGERNDGLAIEHLLKEGKIGSLVSKDGFEAEYYLGSLLFKPNPLDVVISLRVKFLNNSYKMTCYINENLKSKNSPIHILKTAQYPDKIVFSETAYGKKADAEKIRIFCDSIAKSVMNEIEYYRGLSYVVSE